MYWNLRIQIRFLVNGQIIPDCHTLLNKAVLTTNVFIFVVLQANKLSESMKIKENFLLKQQGYQFIQYL